MEALVSLTGSQPTTCPLPSPSSRIYDHGASRRNCFRGSTFVEGRKVASSAPLSLTARKPQRTQDRHSRPRKRLSILLSSLDEAEVFDKREDQAGSEEDELENERQSPYATAKIVYQGSQDESLTAIRANGHSALAAAEAPQSSTPARSDSSPPPPASPNGSGPGSPGSRPGLYRTPVSGGVQSATSSHGLPHPAVAVRNLVEGARFAHLCTIMSRMHHRRRGYPFGSLVDFTCDDRGHPIFSLSPLAIHTRNLLADPRCTLVVQIPGWSGLANARVTLFGDVYPLPPEQQEWAQKLYASKHYHGASQQWGNFYFYRMENISDIYFIGGFGTVAWLDVEEYEAARPDRISSEGAERTLQELNQRFSEPLQRLLSEGGKGVDDACLISIDSKGVDVRVRQGARFNVQRMSFDDHVETLDQAMAALSRSMQSVL